MVDFAARFCRNIIIPWPENMKITEKQVLEIVLKCDFDGFKIAVNKGVTLQRFPAKGHLRRAGDVVLALPPYC